MEKPLKKSLKVHRASEDLNKSKKSNAFRFGPMKEELNVKSIFKPEGPKKPAKKTKKEGKTKKRKPTAEPKSVVIEKPTNEANPDENAQPPRFKPLIQVNEEDFEGMDLTQLERLNMQVSVFYLFYFLHD